MRLCINFICFALLILCVNIGYSQNSPQEKFAHPNYAKRGYIIGLAFTQQYPGMDLKKRFGSNSAMGFSTNFKSKSNWLVGAQFNIIFGNKVIENTVLDSIIGSSNELIDAQGNYSVLRFYERGYNTSIDIGKIINVNKKSLNSGILIQVGVGFIQHKIKFGFATKLTPQLEDGYFKGYDRLSNGMMLNQFIGYQHLHNNGRVNFLLGFEIKEGFTQSRRSWDYDLMKKDNSKRLDILYGLKFGIQIPIYKKSKNEESFYND